MAAIQKDIEGVTEKIEGNSEHQQQKEVVLNPQPELQLDEEPRNKRAQVQHEEEDGQEDIVDYDELEGEEQDGYTDDDAGEIIYFDDDGEIDEEEGDVEWEDDEDEEDDVDDDEYVEVNLVAVRKPFECPICLGIMKETRTLQDCMHRFCRDCIKKEMGLGNNECPVCHVRIESRSSLREDIRYNKMILALFGEVEKNEEQAPVPDKDKSVRGKQVQNEGCQSNQGSNE